MTARKLTSRTLFLLIFVMGSVCAQDWAKTDRFSSSNALILSAAQAEPGIVFMGNSITESWKKLSPNYFADKTHINRGISGQTTPQMLVRFRADVISLQPAIVIILAGTNDLAGNTGPLTLEEILANIMSMSELARVHNIEVILCSVLPATSFFWKPELKPAADIVRLNQMIKSYTVKSGFLYLDYYSALVDDNQGLQGQYTYDGVHPNAAGYHIMEALVDKALLQLELKK